jgi:hypothetical protein
MTNAEKEAREIVREIEEALDRCENVHGIFADRILRFAREHGPALAAPALREVMLPTYDPTTDTRRMEKFLTDGSTPLPFAPVEDTIPPGWDRSVLGGGLVGFTLRHKPTERGDGS